MRKGSSTQLTQLIYALQMCLEGNLTSGMKLRSQEFVIKGDKI